MEVSSHGPGLVVERLRTKGIVGSVPGSQGSRPSGSLAVRDTACWPEGGLGKWTAGWSPFPLPFMCFITTRGSSSPHTTPQGSPHHVWSGEVVTQRQQESPWRAHTQALSVSEAHTESRAAGLPFSIPHPSYKYSEHYQLEGKKKPVLSNPCSCA